MKNSEATSGARFTKTNIFSFHSYYMKKLTQYAKKHTFLSHDELKNMKYTSSRKHSEAVYHKEGNLFLHISHVTNQQKLFSFSRYFS